MKKLIITLTLISIPSVAFAQTNSLRDLVSFIINDIFARGIIPLLILASIAAFFWGLVKFIYQAGDNPQAIAEGKWFMFWGVVALFVMVSVWGITAFISSTFGIRQVVPQLSNGGSSSYSPNNPPPDGTTYNGTFYPNP
jgi:uncharacterized membrane-anchored protein